MWERSRFSCAPGRPLISRPSKSSEHSADEHATSSRVNSAADEARACDTRADLSGGSFAPSPAVLPLLSNLLYLCNPGP